MKGIVKIGGILIALAMLSLLLLNQKSCKSKPNRDRPNTSVKKNCQIRSGSSQVKSGEVIDFKSRSLSQKQVLDSTIYIDDMSMTEGIASTEGLALGRHDLKVKYLYEDSTTCESSWSIEIISEVEPSLMQFNILATYGHDIDSYTQGLAWHEGRIYEGTGQHGESLIHNYDPKKLDYANRVDLPMNLFGEGITILNDKVFQLTYKARKGLVYNLHTMDKVGEFEIPSQEGWGLTEDGESLIMSDGSHTLTYINPENFETTAQVHVYDNKSKVAALNELEYVDGYIYANLYGSYAIAKIEASTGKVVEYVDCSGILAKEFQKPGQDVFNGIAFNPDKRTFFLTGKYWPKLFEVSFLPKAI